MTDRTHSLTTIESDEFTIETAMTIAIQAHKGQPDKGRPSLPYVTHPVRIMTTFDDPILQMIAVLHDVVEDTPLTLDDLRAAGAPERVVTAVALLTHAPGEPRDDYLRRLRENPDALAVKLADNADNSDPSRLELLEPGKAAELRQKYADDRHPARLAVRLARLLTRAERVVTPGAYLWSTPMEHADLSARLQEHRMNPVATLHANLGRPLVLGPLSLFPVFTSAVPAERYRTGPGATRRRTIAIQETDGGNVPELTVVNTDHRPVLLLEGETILGNRQHRTINVSVLVPAGETMTIPVSCVEQGRWGASKASRRSASLSPAGLRSAKLSTVHDRLSFGGRRDADQGVVWNQVAAYAARHDVETATGALEDVHAARADDITKLVGRTGPLDGQRGVIASAGGRVLGLDLFDKPGTLDRYWKALVSAYALDALLDDVSTAAPARLVEEAEAFLRNAIATEGPRVAGVGLGDELHLRSTVVVGHALIWDDAVIHLSAFPA